MLRRLYDATLRLAASPRAPMWLGIQAFAEGLFFPIPPDTLLMPLVLARRERAWIYAGICLSASVLGGSAGFAVGYFLRPVGAWLLALTGTSASGFEHWYGHWGVLLLALPIPYKITAIASGMFKLNYLLFITASIFIRGLRFFAVAALIRTYGASIQSFVERRLALVTGAVGLAVIGLFAGLQLLR
ncbi:MAG: YqaA family protein [Caulobacteraceae bacterium]